MELNIGLPQGIWLILNLIYMLAHMEKHGQPREDTYNGGHAVIGVATGWLLLYWGGFFS